MNRGRGAHQDRGAKRKVSSPKQVTAVPTQLCSVCTNGPPNYKCPKCRSIYCSLACCRKHKEHCQTILAADVTVSPQTTAEETPPLRPTRDFDDVEADWKLTPEMKNRLDSSPWLQKNLADPKLRALIAQIVNTPYELSSGRGETKSKREIELETMKTKHARFASFVDKTLVLTGVLERTEPNPMEIEAWLEQTNVPQALVLKEARSSVERKVPPEDIVAAEATPSSSEDEG